MQVEQGKVRAPEIGRVWLNSAALSLRQLRGRVVLIDFWDYTCVNCIRTLPYVQAWHQRYGDKGLTVIGVHTPEFTFAQYESNVERAVLDLGLTYPVVIDSNYELWKAFANRCWPTKYLLDQESYLRFAHFGEGSYGECEQAIQVLLREVDPALALPPIMKSLREEDHAGAVCYPASPELYLGHRRGRIGNQGGFREDSVADYSFSGDLGENCFYAVGQWASTAEYLEAVGQPPHRLLLKYSAATVNLVMASPRGPACEVIIRQDGKPLSPPQATSDTRFRGDQRPGRKLRPGAVKPACTRWSTTAASEITRWNWSARAGLAAFAFTFTSCVDPVRSSLAASVVQS